MPALVELEDGLGRGAGRRRVPRRARRAAARLRRPAVAAVPGLAAERGRRPPDLPQARGPQPHRRAQDQQRARPGAARPADGQAADHRRDRRRPARRRRRRPRARCSTSSASSTWAPRTCAARSPTSSGCSCSARASSRSRRARGRSRRRCRRRSATGSPTSATTHYIIGSCVGPAPYPALVRDLQRVIGDEARAQMLERDRPAARAGDRLRRRRLQLDRDVHPVRRRRRGRARRRRGGGGGDRDRAPRRAADRRRAARACCTAPTRRSCRTRTARSSRRTRSPPGSTTRQRPGARLAARLGPRPLRGDHRRAGARRVRASARLEGIVPGARERPRARLGAAERRRASSTWSACRAAATRTWPRRCAARRRDERDAGSPARDRRRADRRGVRVGSRRRPAGGADAVPDGRVSRPGDLAPDRRGLRRRRRGPGRARRPVLGPARRRPGDPRRRAPRRCGAERRSPGVLEVAARARDRTSRWCVMCYANPILARGLERVRSMRSSRPGRAGLIVPDLPLEEAPDDARARATPGTRARAARRADHAGGAAGARSAPAPEASSTRCR